MIKYLIFLIILLFNNFILSQNNYNDYIYTYYINGTGLDDNELYQCSETQPCYSLEKVIYFFIDLISDEYPYSYNTYPPLLVYMGEGSSIFSNVDFKPPPSPYDPSSSSERTSLELYNFNLTLVGSQFLEIKNNYSFPLFTVTPDYSRKSTYLKFIDINYGGEDGNCLTNSSSSSSSSTEALNVIGDFIQLEGNEDFLFDLQFVNLNYSCQSSDKQFILVLGEINNEETTASEDWNQYSYYQPYINSQYSITFLNSVFSSAQNFDYSTNIIYYEFNSPIINSTFNPITLSFIHSNFSNNFLNDNPMFIISKGQLIIEKSNLIGVDNTYNQDTCFSPIFLLGNVEVYFNDNSVIEWPIAQNILITCYGCFFTGVGNNISTTYRDSYCGIFTDTFSNPYIQTSNTLFSFKKSSITIMNSNLTQNQSWLAPDTIEASISIVRASESQISLRNNFINSRVGSPLNFASVKSFMFSNVFYGSYDPFVYCDTSSQNYFNGDQFSQSIGTVHGSNCNVYSHNQKIKTSLIFSSIGIAFTFGSMIFLFSARFIIRNCRSPKK